MIPASIRKGMIGEPLALAPWCGERRRLVLWSSLESVRGDALFLFVCRENPSLVAMDEGHYSRKVASLDRYLMSDGRKSPWTLLPKWEGRRWNDVRATLRLLDAHMPDRPARVRVDDAHWAKELARMDRVAQLLAGSRHRVAFDAGLRDEGFDWRPTECIPEDFYAG
ncbi:MAG TPA: hypothetical protein VGE52_12275 [Pirellulales bacterium]